MELNCEDGGRLEGGVDFLDFEIFDDVVGLVIVEIVEFDIVFEVGVDFVGVVFEVFECGNFVFVNDFFVMM